MTIVKCIKSQIYYTNVDLLILCCLKINCHATQAACFLVCLRRKVKMDFHMIKFLLAARFAMRMRKDFLLDFLERIFVEENFLLSMNEAPPTESCFYVVIVLQFLHGCSLVIQTIKYFHDQRDRFLSESSLKLHIKSDNLTWQVVIKLSVKIFPSTEKWEEKMFDDDLLENCHTCSRWSSQKKIFEIFVHVFEAKRHFSTLVGLIKLSVSVVEARLGKIFICCLKIRSFSGQWQSLIREWTAESKKAISFTVIRRDKGKRTTRRTRVPWIKMFMVIASRI